VAEGLVEKIVAAKGERKRNYNGKPFVPQNNLCPRKIRQ